MSEPTPGELRAAKLLIQEHFGPLHGDAKDNLREIQHVAEIIAEATGGRALLEYCEELISQLDGVEICPASIYSIDLGTDDVHEFRAMIAQARK